MSSLPVPGEAVASAAPQDWLSFSVPVPGPDVPQTLAMRKGGEGALASRGEGVGASSPRAPLRSADPVAREASANDAILKEMVDISDSSMARVLDTDDAKPKGIIDENDRATKTQIQDS